MVEQACVLQSVRLDVAAPWLGHARCGMSISASSLSLATKLTHLSSGRSAILTEGIVDEQSIRATSSSLRSWPKRISVKPSRSSSTPETASTSPAPAALTWETRLLIVLRGEVGFCQYNIRNRKRTYKAE